MVDGDEGLGQGDGSLAAGHHINQVTDAGHGDSIGRHQRPPHRCQVFAERLHEKELDALEAGCAHRGDDAADDPGELHDSSYPLPQGAKAPGAIEIGTHLV